MRKIVPTLPNIEWVASEFAFHHKSIATIARDVGVSTAAISSWIDRYARQGLGRDEYFRIWGYKDKRAVIRALLSYPRGKEPVFEQDEGIHSEIQKAIMRRRVALDAIRAGMTVKAIAETLSVTRARAYQICEHARRDVGRALRELETATSLGLPVSDQCRAILIGIELGGELGAPLAEL